MPRGGIIEKSIIWLWCTVVEYLVHLAEGFLYINACHDGPHQSSDARNMFLPNTRHTVRT